MYYKMNPEAKKRWLEMLRSGEIKQTKEALRNGDAMCCLGVLCNVHAEMHPEFAKTQLDVNCYDDQSYALPWAVELWANLGWEEQSRLSDMNDIEGKSFKKIAKYIEKNL